MCLQNSRIAERILFYAAAFYAALFSFSGLLKILNPAPVNTTIRALIHHLFGVSLPRYLVCALVITLILWELASGALYFTRTKRTFALSALLGTDLMFIAISHLLHHLQQLASCGCFGPLSAGFYPIHFMLLYSGGASFLLALICRCRPGSDSS